MALNPNIPKKKPFIIRSCTKCNGSFGPESYSRSKSLFYPDGYLPICNDCIKQILEDNDFSWEVINKVCQYADVPFVPKEWERLFEMNKENTFPIYAKVFEDSMFDDLGWGDYYEKFKELKEYSLIEDELPELREAKFNRLREKWGGNYQAEEDLTYLENLYEGVMATQNVNGALQVDQAVKLCKISLQIDEAIRAGEDIKDYLNAYDKMVKVAEFTPKNVKNASDFESVGELFAFLEKRGWVNRYFDNVNRDIVDESMKNIQSFCQNLYVNEPAIGEDIDKRVEGLKMVKDLEDSYDLNRSYDLDEYDMEGITDLEDEEEFEVEIGDRDV